MSDSQDSLQIWIKCKSIPKLVSASLYKYIYAYSSSTPWRAWSSRTVVGLKNVYFFFKILTWGHFSLFWERERERGIDVRKKHWSVASHTCPNRESNLQPRYVSWSGIKHSPFWFNEMMLQPTEPPSQGKNIYFKSSPYDSEAQLGFRTTGAHDSH